MTTLRRLLVTVLVFISVALAGKGPANPPFFFIQMADPQFGMYTGDRGFEQETKNFEFVIAAANRLRPAFVVVCGDLVNRVGDPEQIAEYLRIAGQLDPDIPLYNVPGNHDVGNVPTPKTLADYRNTFGPDYYTFQANGAIGFVLDSSLISNPTGAPREAEQQEAWLRAELEKAKKAGYHRLFVFQHHSLFLTDPNEADQYFNIPRARRRVYLDLFEKYGISHVFAGHYHRNALGRSGGLEMVTTGPVGKPLGRDPSGVRVVIVRDTGVEHQYYGFDSIPDSLDLDK
jgi:3',5'-cyclic AMP phosphodiesterase CpdA